jgi:hypothetical protein
VGAVLLQCHLPVPEKEPAVQPVGSEVGVPVPKVSVAMVAAVVFAATRWPELAGATFSGATVCLLVELLNNMELFLAYCACAPAMLKVPAKRSNTFFIRYCLIFCKDTMF